MKNSNIKKVILIAVLLVVIIVPSIIFNRTIKNPVKVEGDIIINVKEGDSFYGILNELSQSDKIKGLMSCIKLGLINLL